LRNKLLFNILVKNLVVLKTRLFFNPKVLSFCEVLNKAKRVLILLPTKAESFPKALNHLGSLSAFLQNDNFEKIRSELVFLAKQRIYPEAEKSQV